MKRILLFLATNLAIIMVLGFFMNVVLPMFGIHLGETSSLLVMCAIFGMGGAFISLALSKTMAKASVGAHIIEQPRNREESWLVNTVQQQAERAGIGMPEVAIYDSPEINAFATGMNRNNALVAVSTGLLRNMTQDEAEAVLGHEVSHVANGDMITLTLIQGVLNTFVFFLARIVANALNRGSSSAGMYFLTVMLCQFVFGLFASMIVMAFSRYREFKADAGGADLAGRQKMIAALKRLQGNKEESHLDDRMAAMGIKGKSVLAGLFMSHPPLEKRIRALEQAA